MIKDLSAKLVAAVTEINQKSRQSFAAEQQEIATKKAASAKMHTFMPKQPAPKADPAAVSTSKKMAEAVEGSVPKTPREKELAAKHGHPKRITFGDVLKARGVKMKEEVEELDAGGVQKEELIGNQHKLDKNKNNKIDKHDFELLRKERGVKVEGFMDTMKKIGNKVLDAVAPSDDKLLDNLHKSVHGKNAPNVPKPKPKLKLAHDYVKEEKDEGETAAQEKAEKKKEVPEWKKMLNDPYRKEKSAFNSKQTSTGTVYSRKYEEVVVESKPDELSTRPGMFRSKADMDNRMTKEGQPTSGEKRIQKYLKHTMQRTRKQGGLSGPKGNLPEEVESVAVKHDQYGAGKTLPQFAEDLSWVDVMFDEGIKRVNVEDLELVEEKAVHPDAIHVSNVGGGKYKVHAVGKNFSHGIKVGEHLTDTHLDDFSEMGGKIKTVKPPKKD